MELLNATHMRAGHTLGLDPDGRERIVVVVKGTFNLPFRGGPPSLADEQVDFVYADTFTGDPGQSAPVYESDFAPFKPRCDVMLVGSAHAPGGRPAKSVPVALKVGAMTKSFEVSGDRYWTGGVWGLRPSSPVPFTSLPISYDRAFGGSDASPTDPQLVDSYDLNPVGVGYHPKLADTKIFGTAVPNTYEIGHPIESPRGRYRPMSLGPLGRNFKPRIKLSGTYDQKWLDEVFPFLPSDFQFDYFQAAPSDQQIPHPHGGEMVYIMNLSAIQLPAFELPRLEVPVELTHASLERTTRQAVLDTIVFEPDQGRMVLTWRTSLHLRRNIQEIVQVVVGRMSRGWYRARALGKAYYPSLRHLVQSKRED